MLGEVVLAAQGKGMLVWPPLVLLHECGMCSSQLVSEPWGDAGEYGMCVSQLLSTCSLSLLVYSLHLVQCSVQGRLAVKCAHIFFFQEGKLA